MDAGVVVVGVGCDEQVDLGDSKRGELVVGVARGLAAVDERGVAVRGSDEDRVPLTHVEEADLKVGGGESEGGEEKHE